MSVRRSSVWGRVTNCYSALNPCRLNLIPPTSVQSSTPTTHVPTQSSCLTSRLNVSYHTRETTKKSVSESQPVLLGFFYDIVGDIWMAIFGRYFCQLGISLTFPPFRHGVQNQSPTRSAHVSSNDRNCMIFLSSFLRAEPPRHHP